MLAGTFLDPGTPSSWDPDEVEPEKGEAQAHVRQRSVIPLPPEVLPAPPRLPPNVFPLGAISSGSEFLAALRGFKATSFSRGEEEQPLPSPGGEGAVRGLFNLI